MNLMISLCKVCICSCLGFGMKVSPFLSTFFCVSVSVVCLASITSALSSVLFSVLLWLIYCDWL